jgi:hypothetical protein
VRSTSYIRVINIYIDTQCCRICEDITDFRFELGVERRTTVVELVGLSKLNYEAEAPKKRF